MTTHDDIRAVFRGEAKDILEALAAVVDGLPDAGAERQDAMRTFMRHAHNFKGAAAVAGYEDLELLAHALEDAMGPFARSSAPIPEELLIVVESTLGLMQRLVEGESLPEVVQEMLRELGANAPAAVEAAPSPAATPAVAAPHDETAPAARHGGTPPVASPRRRDGRGQHSIRVDTSRLDGLMDFAGELLAAQSRRAALSERIAEFSARFREAFAGAGLGGDSRWRELARDLEAIAGEDRASLLGFVQLTGEINAAMKRVRMLPLRELAPVWRRLLGDTAAKLGKSVELDLDLGDIELDRYVLDSLRDPLMHFLRNAVDHGIESPEERLAAGKPRAGRVLIRSSMNGAVVRLEISDDGRGLDRRRIADAAVAKGLVRREALERRNDAEVLALLFAPGFSTSAGVSRISGRGVGLDVVRSRIQELGGTVEIAPAPVLGGATFVLSVPVSLLSSKGLLVRAGGSSYVLPTDRVLGTRRIDRASVRELSGALVADDGGRPLELSFLAELASRGASRRQPAKLSVVLVAHGGERLGLVVDEVVREQELVTKRLPWNLRRVRGVNGAVVLADGSVAAAVDVGHLVEARRANPASVATAASTARRVAALVVEDSATARAELAKVLGEASYEVAVAADGEEGWARLAQGGVDVVITDVQMPRLDGLELTRRIRSSAAHEGLPVILVTSLDGADDIAAGAAAGADEYLVKGKYGPDDLFRAIDRLVRTGS